MVLVFRDDSSEGSWSSTAIRKGPWTEEEDARLAYHVGLLGDRRWDFLAKVSGLRRTGKSCRLRWVNYLHPDLKRGRLKPEEERRVIELHAIWGNRWSRIAKCLPGRTDNEIKNYWRTHMRKKAQEQRRKLAAGAAATTNATDVNSSGASHSCSSSTLSYSGSSNSIDCMFHPQLAAHELLPHLQLQNSDATGWPVVSGCGGEVDDVAGSWVGLQACWDDAGWGSPGCSGNDSYQKQSMPVSGILNDHGAAANHSFCPPTSEQALVMPPPPSPLWEYSTHPIWKLLNEDDHDGLIFPSSCWN